MRLDHFTVKSQEALERAQRLAREHDHQELTADHLLAALLEAREALALRAAASGAAHANETDIEARLLRSLAALDAALGELRTASGGAAPTTGF